MKKPILLLTTILLTMLSAYAQHENNEGDTEKLKALSNEWMIAAMKRDEKTLNTIVAPEFKLGGTDFGNPPLTREIWLKNTMVNLKIDSVKYEKMQVDVIDNIAIVQSVFYWSVAFGELPAQAQTVNLIDTWIKRKQGWQIVSRLVVDK